MEVNLNGFFDVHSFYNSLSTPPTFHFPWKCIWNVKVPRRVSFFLWTEAWDSILTIDNLVKRNLPWVNWCCLYRCVEKQWIIFYFIVSSHMPYGVKFFFFFNFIMFGIQWMMPGMVVSLLCAWKNYLGIHSSSF